MKQRKEGAYYYLIPGGTLLQDLRNGTSLFWKVESLGGAPTAFACRSHSLFQNRAHDFLKVFLKVSTKQYFPASLKNETI